MKEATRALAAGKRAVIARLFKARQCGKIALLSRPGARVYRGSAGRIPLPNDRTGESGNPAIAGRNLFAALQPPAERLVPDGVCAAGKVESAPGANPADRMPEAVGSAPGCPAGSARSDREPWCGKTRSMNPALYKNTSRFAYHSARLLSAPLCPAVRIPALPEAERRRARHTMRR